LESRININQIPRTKFNKCTVGNKT